MTTTTRLGLIASGQVSQNQVKTQHLCLVEVKAQSKTIEEKKEKMRRFVVSSTILCSSMSLVQAFSSMPPYQPPPPPQGPREPGLDGAAVDYSGDSNYVPPPPGSRTAHTVGQPLLRSTDRRDPSGYANDGRPDGAWWDNAGVASHHGTAGNFQTWTDQQRRMARGKPNLPPTGSALDRPGSELGGGGGVVPAHRRPPPAGAAAWDAAKRHIDESNLDDGRSPSKYENTPAYGGVNANNAWWDNAGTHGRYGTSGNFKSYTDLQLDRSRQARQEGFRNKRNNGDGFPPDDGSGMDNNGWVRVQGG